jgi:hypothetical protein
MIPTVFDVTRNTRPDRLARDIVASLRQGQPVMLTGGRKNHSTIGRMIAAVVDEVPDVAALEVASGNPWVTLITRR